MMYPADFLEAVLSELEAGQQPSPPQALRLLIDRWPWGKYGWTSPVNLLITAAWYKALNPQSDCCKIWSIDAQSKAIAGAYSIRTLDESFTVPFVNRHDIFKSFCSPNSGMQGSRALEKGRSVTGRLDRNWSANQRTLFDLDLFSEIMNDIDHLDSDQATETLKYLLSIAIAFRKQRIKAQEAILNIRYGSSVAGLATLPEQFNDPEFSRALTAALLGTAIEVLAPSWSVKGTDGAKTAADSQSGNPGDLWIEDSGGFPIVGFEIKDQTRTIDWTILRRASDFLKTFPTIRAFFIVTANKAPLNDRVAAELRNPAALFAHDPYQRNVSTVSIYDLINIAVVAGKSGEVLSRTGSLIATMISIKPETRELWTRLFG